MKIYLRFTYLALAFALSAGTAGAIPMLRVSDGITSFTISDFGLGDNNTSAGAVTWIGSLGIWSVNVTGTTKPVLGYGNIPIMDLGFVTSSSGAGTLTMMFTETGFTASRGGWTNMSESGTTAGSVKYDLYGGTSNTGFDTTRLLDTLGTLTGTYSARDAHTYVKFFNPVSLTQVLTITHSGPGISVGTAYLKIPEDGTASLFLASALMCIGLAARLVRRER